MDDSQDLTMSCLFARKFNPELMLTQEYRKYTSDSKQSDVIKLSESFQEMFDRLSPEHFTGWSKQDSERFDFFDALSSVLLCDTREDGDPYSQMYLYCDMCGIEKNILNTNHVDYGLCFNCEERLNKDMDISIV